MEWLNFEHEIIYFPGIKTALCAIFKTFIFVVNYFMLPYVKNVSF